MEKNKLTNDLIITRCFCCKNIYVEELTKLIKIKEPFEESFHYVKRFVCNGCYEKIQKNKTIQIISEKTNINFSKKMKGGNKEDE